MTRHDLFIGGVPATGKSLLGQWLAEKHGYFHIDAERVAGADFDRLSVHDEWNELISSGCATKFVNAIRKLTSSVVVNWGFPTRFLYVVSALQAEGFCTWWLDAPRNTARSAFMARGGIDPLCFDRQMDDIEREWLLIKFVFGSRMVTTLHSDGSQRTPEQLWVEIAKSC